LLPTDSFACIYGPSGSFKSFLALSLCCHVAAGLQWDGRSVEKGSVLYVAGEGGIGVSRRVRAWEQKYGRASLNTFARVDSPVFPADPLQVKELVKACKEIEERTGEPMKLIVVDTLARCYGGNDENSAKDMGAFIKGCDQIRKQTGATLLVVHHTGKNAENGARGSSALRAALDVEILVTRETNFSVMVECTKMKDAEQPSGLAFDLDTVHVTTDEENQIVTSLALIDQSREPKEKVNQQRPLTQYQQALWQTLRSRTEHGDPTTVAVVRDDLKSQGINTNNFMRWVKELEAKGLMSKDGENLSLSALEDVA